MAARFASVLLACLALGSTVVLGSACDSGGGTVNPDEENDDDLGDGELSGQGPGGIGAVTGAMDADPKVVEAEAMLADGKAERALALIDEALSEQPDQARFHYVRGNALTYLDRNDEAQAAYERAIELDAKDPLPYAALGQLVAFREGAGKADKQRAIELFQTALQLEPKLGPAHQSLGVVLLSLDQPEQAVEALENADRLAGNVETAYLLAQAHGELGHYAEAVEFAASAVEYEPGASGADLRLLHARLLLKADQREAAAREFEQVAKLVPDSPPLRLEVARGLLDLGEADAAMVHLEWLVDKLPDEIPVIVNHGRALVAQGKAKQAIARFDEALARDPSSRAALMYKIEAEVAAKRCKAGHATFATLAEALGWKATKAILAKPEELPRALSKARGFLLPACE